MKHYKEFLKCTHPIVCVPMNQCSDINLAIAVHNAGAFPSMSMFNFHTDRKINMQLTEYELNRFQDATGSNNALIGMGWDELLNPEFINLLDKMGFKFLEVFHLPKDNPRWPEVRKTVSELRSIGFKIIFKVQKHLSKVEQDAVIIKGKDGAGRTPEDGLPVKEFFSVMKAARPEVNIIPSGGISTSEQVNYYMAHGAMAVGIGTLFAASEESPVSLETKLKIVDSTSEDLKRIGKLNHQGLLFKNIEDGDDNNNQALMQGMRGTSNGCIYAGAGIDSVKEILPVKDIVQRLVKDLNDNQ